MKIKIVKKPWGREEIWAKTPKYVGKILYIKDTHRLSKQYHRYKSETLRVLRGEVMLEIGVDIKKDLKEITLKAGDVYHIPPYMVHRIIARTEAEVLEVSTPELDDVVRLEDAYSRN